MPLLIQINAANATFFRLTAVNAAIFPVERR